MIADVWADAKQIIGSERLTLGPQASHQLINDPAHYCMVLARYRAAAALIGDAESVLEIGCGEGIGAGILAKGRIAYHGTDTDHEAVLQAMNTYPATWEQNERGNHVLNHTRGFNLWEIDACKQSLSRVLTEIPIEAVVSLDVIEHIPAELEDAFMTNAIAALNDHGVMVIGTPNKAFEHLASPQSRAGHVNPYTHDRLHALMSRYFHTVQSFGMQDTSIHLGHPEARHYLLFAGIGPRR